ncbi:hypothetical protein LSAT2_012077 [Lamellibrachia satsuma]|nr:hypothetical protein LSAT2_012077 [Lamellibrachia satsuma]
MATSDKQLQRALMILKTLRLEDVAGKVQTSKHKPIVFQPFYPSGACFNAPYWSDPRDIEHLRSSGQLATRNTKHKTGKSISDGLSVSCETAKPLRVTVHVFQVF